MSRKSAALRGTWWACQEHGLQEEGPLFVGHVPYCRADDCERQVELVHRVADDPKDPSLSWRKSPTAKTRRAPPRGHVPPKPKKPQEKPVGGPTTADSTREGPVRRPAAPPEPTEEPADMTPPTDIEDPTARAYIERLRERFEPHETEIRKLLRAINAIRLVEGREPVESVVVHAEPEPPPRAPRPLDQLELTVDLERSSTDRARPDPPAERRPPPPGGGTAGDLVLAVLRDAGGGPLAAKVLADAVEATGLSRSGVYPLLRRLLKAGQITNPRKGKYALATEEAA